MHKPTVSYLSPALIREETENDCKRTNCKKWKILTRFRHERFIDEREAMTRASSVRLLLTVVARLLRAKAAALPKPP